MAVLVYLWVIIELLIKFAKIQIGSVYKLFYLLSLIIGILFFGVCVVIVLSKFAQKFVEIDLLYGFLALQMFIMNFFGDLSEKYSNNHK